MPKVENTPCNCYKVEMGASKLEAPVPCAFEVPSTFSNKFKISNAKNALTCVLPIPNIEPHGIHHPFLSCKIPQLARMFGPFGIIKCDLMIMLPPYMNVPNPR
jgi:hypothetical protein